jgi:hypothetical protein
MSEPQKPSIYSASDVFHMQRTEAGLAYERKLNKLRTLHRTGDPAVKHLVQETSEYIRSLAGNSERAGVGVAPGSVHSNTFLSGFSLAYQNDEFIGERCMPVVLVDHRSDAYATYGQRDRLGIMDDSIGPRGKVNEVSETRSSDNYSVKDRALQNFIDASTLANEDPVFDEMLDLIDAVNANLGLAREARIAAAVQLSTNYAATTTLSGADQWNSATGGDPLKNIQDGVAALWGGMGQTDIIGVTNLDTYNALTRHPAILDLLKYTASGLASKQQLASILGLTDILVGAARKDTANIGQTASYSRVWTDSFSILRVARRPTKRSAHFGSTFRMKSHPITTQWFEEDCGMAGGYYAKVGCSEDHKVVSTQAGFMFVDCLA